MGAFIPLATPARISGSFPTSVITATGIPLTTYKAADGFKHWKSNTTTNSTDTTTSTSWGPSTALRIGMSCGVSLGAIIVAVSFLAFWRIVLKKPIPIISRFTTKRWIDPNATELENRGPQPPVSEALGFPWAFDKPVGWSELDPQMKSVEMEGDCRLRSSAELKCKRPETDTERHEIADKESIIIPPGAELSASSATDSAPTIFTHTTGSRSTTVPSDWSNFVTSIVELPPIWSFRSDGRPGSMMALGDRSQRVNTPHNPATNESTGDTLLGELMRQKS
ncbi:hypothetical protein BKA67DRAFT_660325 [Truncatella angustata]|uniref:Uncharacterized protein n=1 Tax=Truncatella angustata TaxID=152316 RepID=A0A9P8UG16_9PEZI|nr:uncharacterized protein BKA67DRAFT_660325 [Truncatella angustata]KAH6651521.1 hypothetical protein BKA67DRAFT_660325 [Truncatella angustata]KAH8204123.1 hypothetical protein TruAng_001675 [Truncatella angustata]